MAANDTIRFAHLFEDFAEGDPETQYLFIDDFAGGHFQRAQRVWKLQTGEVQVRKVCRTRLPLSQARASPDNEIQIMKYLDANRPAGILLPNIAQLLSHTEYRWVQPRLDTHEKLSRISYWRYYNGHDIGHLLSMYRTYRRNECIPDAFIVRLTRQMLQAFQLLYRLRVIHRDIHDGNVFLQYEPQGADDLPNCFLGDFGSAQKVLLGPGDDPVHVQGWSDEYNDLYPREQYSADLRQLLELVKLLARHGHLMQGTPEGNAVIQEHGYEEATELALELCSPAIRSLMQSLQYVADEHVGPMRGPVSDPRTGQFYPARKTLPNLEPLITFTQSLERTIVARPTSFTSFLRASALRNVATLRPLYYRHHDGIVYPRRRVLGPWYVAHVDKRTHRLINYEDDQQYHRPNRRDDYSDTDEEVVKRERAGLEDSDSDSDSDYGSDSE